MDMTAYFMGRNAAEAGGASGEGLNIIEEVDIAEPHLSKDIYNAPALDVAFGGVIELLDEKQEDLVSGENIKTINGQSILGNGDLSIAGGNIEIPKNVETTDNKVESIDENSTDTQYPSAKAVKQAIEKALAGFEPPEQDTGSGVSEAQKQTLLAIVNAIGLFNVPNAQTLLDNFNKAWNTVDPVPATSITLDKTEITFTAEETQTIVASVLPANTTDVVVWTSSNNAVATVKNGVVTPLVDGEAVITATAGNVSATCAVIVNIYGEIENPVFLTAGVLNTSSTATSDPIPSETYNRSCSFNAVPVKKNDILTCKSDCDRPKDWYKFFIYDTDGANCTALWSTAAQGWDTVTATKDGFIRLSILGHATGNDGLTNVITEYSVISNGVKTTYAVVDKR